MTLSKARKRANKKYNSKEEVKEKRRVYVARSTARCFIKEMAATEDIDELQKLLDQRRVEADLCG